MAETGKERLLRAQLATLLWEKTGIVRREKDLKAALRELEKMKAKADKLYARGVSFEGAELRHAILTATIVTQGALHRRESRGAHYRSDYPLKSKRARHSQASLRR